MVSPYRAITAPSACLANRPVSREKLFPLFQFPWNFHYTLLVVGNSLLTYLQFFNDLPVPINVLLAEIIQQPAAFADHLEQADAREMVLGKFLEMRRQIIDARREQRDLHFGDSGVLRRLAVFSMMSAFVSFVIAIPLLLALCWRIGHARCGPDALLPVFSKLCHQLRKRSELVLIAETAEKGYGHFLTIDVSIKIQNVDFKDRGDPAVTVGRTPIFMMP